MVWIIKKRRPTGWIHHLIKQ